MRLYSQGDPKGWKDVVEKAWGDGLKVRSSAWSVSRKSLLG